MQLKKRLIALLLSLSMLLSLCGCGIYDVLFPDCTELAAESVFNSDVISRENIVPFDDVKYIRPDIAALEAKSEEIKLLLESFLNAKEVVLGLNEYFVMYSNFYTMMTLANIRHCIDTDDGFYLEENSFCNEAVADVDYYTDCLLLACSNSFLSDYLDEFYFNGLLSEQYSVTDGSGYTPSDELAELERKEAELENDYSVLYSKYSSDFDKGSYKKHNNEMGKIYVELIKVRNEIAKLRNEASYCLLAYNINGRDYSADELSSYTEAIKKDIIPLYKEAASRGLLDSSLLAKQTADKAFALMTGAVRGLDTRIDEALDYMLEYKLYNIESSDRKYDQSYVVYLDDYNSPFLFCNPTGYNDTVLSLAHEFGHYVDGYLNFGTNPSLDTSEMFSQSMEYLLLCNLNDSDSADTLTRYKMLDVLMLYTFQAAFNEFEQRAYALADDELSLDKLNSIFSEIVKEFGLDEQYGDEVYNYWIAIPHLFTSPFYVISYCVSDSAAFELYNMEHEKKGSGLAMYMKLLDESTHYDFLELVDACGMRSPISADTVREIADTLSAKLGL